MKVALISQGPSASLWTGERDQYEAVIGVNSTPTRWACDFWVFVDYGAFSKQQPDGGRWCDQVIGKPKIVTRPGNRERLARESPAVAPVMEGFAWSLLPYKAIPSLPTGGASWPRQGGLAGLALAWSLKPERVDCYGVDMDGKLDVRGCDCGSNARSPRRWENEKFTWAAMVARMNGDGITVSRALADGSFSEFSPENPTAITSITRWQYDNGQGWTSIVWPAAGEYDFRQRLSRLIGPTKAHKVPVRQVA